MVGVGGLSRLFRDSTIVADFFNFYLDRRWYFSYVKPTPDDLCEVWIVPNEFFFVVWKRP